MEELADACKSTRKHSPITATKHTWCSPDPQAIQGPVHHPPRACVPEDHRRPPVHWAPATWPPWHCLSSIPRALSYMGMRPRGPGVCTPHSPCTRTSEASGLHLRREHSHTWNLFLVCACWTRWRHLHHEAQQDREPTSTHSHLGDRPEHYVQ